jgi:glycosyltransferase involved in cell wall biosynthesis
MIIPKAISSNKSILMVGPHPNGMGGISKVVKLWVSSGILREHHVRYISSVVDGYPQKLFQFTGSLMLFTILLLSNYKTAYIHTASHKSFVRKSFFIFIALLMRRKTILHIHPSFFYTYILNIKGLWKWITYRMLNAINTFVVLTPGMRNDMLSLFPDKKIYVLPNPVDIQTFQKDVDQPREKNKILYLGRYSKTKGAYDLVDAIGLLHNQGVHIDSDFYGNGEVNDLRLYVRDKRLNNCITIHDWVDDQVKIQALKSSTVLALPSHTEGMPIVILEAMAAQTPILSTLAGGLKDILKDKENAVIHDVMNPADLSEKLNLILNDQHLREKITSNAFRQAKKEYDITVIKVKFKNVIKDLDN